MYDICRKHYRYSQTASCAVVQDSQCIPMVTTQEVPGTPFPSYMILTHLASDVEASRGCKSSVHNGRDAWAQDNDFHTGSRALRLSPFLKFLASRARDA